MKKKGETQIISASTILILSGFLIGLTVGKIVSESLSPYVLSCGLAGFLAFIALEFTGTQREEEEAHVEQVHVQGRLDRHVMSLSSISFTMPGDHQSSNSRKSDLGKSGIDQQMLDDLYQQLTTTENATESEAVPSQDAVES